MQCEVDLAACPFGFHVPIENAVLAKWLKMLYCRSQWRRDQNLKRPRLVPTTMLPEGVLPVGDRSIDCGRGRLAVRDFDTSLATLLELHGWLTLTSLVVLRGFLDEVEIHHSIAMEAASPSLLCSPWLGVLSGSKFEDIAGSLWVNGEEEAVMVRGNS